MWWRAEADRIRRQTLRLEIGGTEVVPTSARRSCDGIKDQHVLITINVMLTIGLTCNPLCQ